MDYYYLIGGYAIVVFLITYLYSKGIIKTKLNFLVANRNIQGKFAAFSIAASWIWAPALFISAQKAYQQGITGLFWFTVPNILCLVVFAYFAVRLRENHPDGFSITSYVGENISKRVHNIFLAENLGLQICSFAVQLLAGATVFHLLTGINFFVLTVIMAIIPLIYSLYGGIRASIMTDYWQMLIIIVVLGIIAPLLFVKVDLNTVISGLGGISGNFGNLISKYGFIVFLSFGIPASIGLMSGPFGDQQFYQRVFSIKKSELKGAFIKGAFIFAVVPILIGLLGFSMAGAGIEVADPQNVNVLAVQHWFSKLVFMGFLVLIFSGLLSTIDSAINAFGSMIGHDIVERTSKDKSLMITRISMLLLAVIALVIANLPGMKILYLWLFFGIMRSAVLIPTMRIILKKKIYEGGLFWGLLISFFVGLPIFTLGKPKGDLTLILIGTFVTVLVSGIMSALPIGRRIKYESPKVKD